MRYEEIITLENVDIDVTYDWCRDDESSYVEIVELNIGNQNVYDLLDQRHEQICELLYAKLKHDNDL